MFRKYLIFLFFINLIYALDNKNTNIIEQQISDIDNSIKNQPENRFADIAIVRILNKITGKTTILTIEIGKNITFEDLDLQFLKCWKSYPQEVPENKLLLKINDNTISDLKKINVFFGWIFSSSHSLNGLEHQYYDIDLVDCKFNENTNENR